MSAGAGCFAPTYAEARQAFLARAAAAGAELESEPHPLPGRDGELLAIDAARLGPADAPALLIVASGCHGVEGFCGSGIQNALLADPDLAAAANAQGVSLLLLHAINPHGFSWWRRTTNENVDLNRNFVDFTQPLPPERGYAAIADLVVPPQWPPGEAQMRALGARAAAAGGERAMQAIVTGGQYTHPDGLFYGGREPCWSHRALRRLLTRHGRRCRRVALVDLHSGLGPPGHAEPILSGPPESAERARAFWPGTTGREDQAVATQVEGGWWHAVVQECPQAEYTGIVLEFGTVPLPQVFDALREEQWATNQGDALDPARLAAARRRLRDAFFVDEAGWQTAVLEQGEAAVHQALAGLASG